WGGSRNHADSPAPSRKAARLAVHPPRTRIIAMSTGGLRLRSSTRIHRQQTARPTASSASVGSPVQPQAVAWAMAMSTQDMPVVISAAAAQLTRPGERTFDHEPETSADPEDRRHQPDAARDAVGRELVPDDR